MDKKEIIHAVPMEMSPKDLASVMHAEGERRKLVTEFISQHMKEGVDYGTIQIGGRASKPSLFKPGSEKFLSLFKLTATFKKDTETWEMAGSIAGLFTYICEIRTSKGDVVGEGRGAANLREKNNWTVNSAVKIAEKRAQVDAVLRMGALSDFFTQDLEDMPPTSYDTTPVPAKAKVVTYVDNIEDPREYDAPDPVPLKIPVTLDDKPDSPAKIKEQRKRIQSLLILLSPIAPQTKEEYGDACYALTGLTLDQWNYKEIIVSLEGQYEKED